MLTDRTDEIVRQFLADPFISTDAAAPDGLSLLILSHLYSIFCLGLSLDIGLVVLISTGSHIT